MHHLRFRVTAAFGASALVMASMVLVAAPVGAIPTQQSPWARQADRICSRADDRMFSQLDRHADLDVTVPLADLTRQERRELLAILKIVGNTATRAAADLSAVRARSADRSAIKAVIKALKHSAKTQRGAAVETRRPPDDSLLLVADTAAPDEIAAVGIERAGALGAHECGVLLGDLLWYREVSLLLGSGPEEIAGFLVSTGPAGFTVGFTGAIDIAQLAEEFAGPDESADDAMIRLQDLGFNAGQVVEFDRANTPDSASIEVLEFGDPAGAAEYLDGVRWGTEDDIDDVYTVSELDSAWGYSEGLPSGAVSRYVAFRAGALVFYVGMTGVPGYSEADVLQFAQVQLDFVENGPPGATNTPEDAIGAGVEAAGERYAGDCSTVDPTADVGSYCSLLLEDHGSSRLYGVGPVASEITDRVTLSVEDHLWVVTP